MPRQFEQENFELLLLAVSADLLVVVEGLTALSAHYQAVVELVVELLFVVIELSEVDLSVDCFGFALEFGLI